MTLRGGVPLRSRATVVMLVGVATGCADSSRVDDVVRRDSAGVEIVTSSDVDRPLAWTFARELTLGGAEDGPESFSFIHAQYTGTDTSGNLFVLNRQTFSVAVFGPDGAFLREMGSEGEGPGELMIPAGVVVAPDGAVEVFDYGRGALIRFDPAGESLPPTPFPMFPPTESNRHMALTGADHWVATVSRSGTRKSALLRWPRTGGGDTMTVASVPLPGSEMVMYDCVGLNLPPLFSPSIIWAVTETGVAIATSAAYAIDMYGPDGRRVRSVRRSLAPRHATEEMAREEVGEAMKIRVGGQGDCEIPAAELVAGRGFAEKVPHIVDVLMGADGELWVRRKVLGPDQRRDPTIGWIDVFDASGAYMGTLPEGTPFPLFPLPGERVAVAETDALDIQRLVLLRVNRGGDVRLESAEN